MGVGLSMVGSPFVFFFSWIFSTVSVDCVHVYGSFHEGTIISIKYSQHLDPPLKWVDPVNSNCGFSGVVSTRGAGINLGSTGCQSQRAQLIPIINHFGLEMTTVIAIINHNSHLNALLMTIIVDPLWIPQSFLGNQTLADPGEKWW